MSTREQHQPRRMNRWTMIEQAIPFAMAIVGVAVIGYIAGYEGGFSAGRADAYDFALSSGSFVVDGFEYQVRRVQP